MKHAVNPARFTAVVLEGHKENAFEVPFDPAERWGVAPHALWPGRRGHHVGGTINGVAFESVCVPRSKRFWVLITDAMETAARLKAGDPVRVVLELRGVA